MENIRSFLGLKTKPITRKHSSRAQHSRKQHSRKQHSRKQHSRKQSRGKSMRRGGGDVPAGFHRMPDGTIMSDADHKGGNVHAEQMGGMACGMMGGKAHAMHMGGKSVGGNVIAEAVVPFGLYGVQKMLQRRSKKSKKDSRHKRAYYK